MIRHGRSLADDENKIEGAGWDAPLTAEGERQARLVANRLNSEGYRPDVLLASPLQRAARVAEIISAVIGGPEVIHDPRLSEVHTGQLGGLTEAEAERIHPRPAGGFRSYIPMPGGECHLDQVGRVLHFFAELADHHGSDSVLIVAHGGTLSRLLQVIYGLTLWAPLLDRPFFRFYTGDTGIHRLTVREGSVVTHFLNDTAHLQ